MVKRLLLVAALALVGAAFFISCQRNSSHELNANSFVQTRGSRFVIAGRPFRFVGANVSVMYRDEDRLRMPETLRQAAQMGIKVVRVWASGEGGPNDVKPI